MDFVETYRQYRQRAVDPSVGAFFRWLSDHCGVTAGDVITDEELEQIGALAHESPSDLEADLMASAWP